MFGQIILATVVCDTFSRVYESFEQVCQQTGVLQVWVNVRVNPLVMLHFCHRPVFPRIHMMNSMIAVVERKIIQPTVDKISAVIIL